MYKTIHFKLRIGVAFTFMVLPELLAASNFGLRHNPYRDTGKHHVFETTQAIKDKVLHRYESNNRMKKVNALQIILDNFPQQGAVSNLPAELGLEFMFSYLKAMLGYDAEQPIDKGTFAYLMECQKGSEQWTDYNKVFHLEYDINDYQDKSGTLYQLAQSKFTQDGQSVVEKSENGVYSLYLPGNLEADKQWLEKEATKDRRIKLMFETTPSHSCKNHAILSELPKILLRYRQAITDPDGFAKSVLDQVRYSNTSYASNTTYLNVMNNLFYFDLFVLDKIFTNESGQLDDRGTIKRLFADKNPSVCTSRLAAILLNARASDVDPEPLIQFSAKATVVDEPA